SDHEGERADARSRRVGRRRRQPAEPEDPACGGDVLVDGIARCTGLERAARDDEPVADGRDRGVPERVRQAGDDPRASTGAPRAGPARVAVTIASVDTSAGVRPPTSTAPPAYDAAAASCTGASSMPAATGTRRRTSGSARTCFTGSGFTPVVTCCACLCAPPH